MSNSKREKMVAHALEYLGHVVVWGDLDCSDLVARAFLAVGLPDRRATWRAQDFADKLAPIEGHPDLGDLGFYGLDWQHVIHVVIHLGGGRVLSADGATRRITTELQARAAHAFVRIHETAAYRHDVRFLGWRRSPLDANGHSTLDTPHPPRSNDDGPINPRSEDE